MKRALKKREKAVLENTQSEEVPVEQQNPVNSRIHRLVPTKAAMIGLAISMGATSLLVTRQSDQALAAEPVGNQNTASTLPATADAELKIARTNHLESDTESSVSQPENPVLVEPTAISQMPGLRAKWQIVTNGVTVPTHGPVVVPTKAPIANRVDVPSGNTNTQIPIQTLSNGYEVTRNQTTSFAAQPQTVVEDNTVSSEVNAQLKAQQEFALYRLQEKSDRLRASLAQLRSQRTTELPKVVTNQAQPESAVANPTSQANASSTFTVQSQTTSDSSQASLVSRLKQKNVVNVPTTAATPTVSTPVIISTVATAKVVTSSASATYEVKPGDTLAAIARAYGTSVSELAKANHLSNPNQLKINQKLNIPTTKVDKAATTAPVAVKASAFELTRNSKVTNPSPNSVIADTSTPGIGSSPLNNQIQANTVNTEYYSTDSTTNTNKTATVPATENAYGMGGDTPIPTAITEMQLARKQDATKSKNAKNTNPRLNSLKAEIERLRAKYRAQQSGNTTVVEEVSNNTAAVQIPVAQPNNVAIPIPVSRPSSNVVVPTSVNKPNPVAVSIPVPRPRISTYPTTRQNKEPINPEFASNQTQKVATPSMGGDVSQSFNAKRGTQVSPELPPLAAVDTYLPKPIEEITPTATGYIWPAKGVLTSGYGWRWGRMHRGIDIANGVGTPIYASSGGVVEKAGWNNGGYGNLVDIRHPDGSLTRYGHNSKVLVRVGQRVEQGDTIALMGSTGFSTGPHSHFEIHPTGKGAVNPMAFLPPQQRI
ncbi:peptidase M23 [Fischerella thermalis CCMEE 5268]|uniref:Peptidase M23 n=1 Tax=Fischerella thermalis CCMEE 5268 TaxID=2019662 RepID=A0A2N6KHY7_9CYAN|nr:peptidoglycan DD-metalloendopeptidase family protein [Fischerella thermalis]PLZ99043.1 peptidase M23 [Fischerella thermalis CCMEE 5268]